MVMGNFEGSPVHSKPLRVSVAVYAATELIQCSTTASRLLQLTAMLLTSWCHITFPREKSTLCDAACHHKLVDHLFIFGTGNYRTDLRDGLSLALSSSTKHDYFVG